MKISLKYNKKHLVKYLIVKLLTIGLLFLIFFIGYQVYMIRQQNIKIEREIIKIENLTQGFEGVRIVHISDLHSSKFNKKEKEILTIINQLNPDFIFITGDFVSKRPDIESINNFFWQVLGERYSNRIFGVWGNHDHWYKNFEMLKKKLKQSQIEILENENKKLKIGSEKDYIYLIGVDDPHTNRDDLLRAMQGITDKTIPQILLAHSPDIINKAKEQGIDLVLTGHNHGGQIVFPFIGPIFVPSKSGRKYLKGLFKENSTYLYVNRGIGTSLLPIRNVPLEITLIELQKNEANINY